MRCHNAAPRGITSGRLKMSEATQKKYIACHRDLQTSFRQLFAAVQVATARRTIFSDGRFGQLIYSRTAGSLSQNPLISATELTFPLAS